MTKQEKISVYKPERRSNFELLRIVSMLMIVASHWGWWSYSFPNALEDYGQKLFHSYFRSFGQVGVVLFILISGYFMCKNQFKIAGLIKLLAQIFCTIFFLLAVFYVKGYITTGAIPSMGLVAFTNWFIPISTGRWWFVSCYVALFMLSPFLNKMIERLKKSEFRILLAVMFVFLSVIPSFFVAVATADVGQSIAVFIFVYLVGAYIRLYEEDFKSKFLCFGGAFLSLAILLVGRKYGFGEYRYLVHLIAFCVFLFLSFMHINIQSRFINKCAKTTFGVYLIHENSVITFWLWNEIFAIQKFANTPWFIPFSILSVVATFAVCAVIEYLRQISIEPLIMKGMKTKKISGWLAAVDAKMPENCVKAEEGAKHDAAPAIVLLATAALYFACEMLEYLTNKPISYKLFLLITIAAIIASAIIKRCPKPSKTNN
ncbi:MAG: acyltransferase [Clostridia bacterium]|nr:acyltransferase [Clostridia bacterium]